jgi:hypothetical protein
MEDHMLKRLPLCAVLTVLSMGSLSAQQEAVLQKVEIPGADFDITLAVPKYPAGAIRDLGKSPDALILHLIGGQLVVGFDTPEKMVAALESVRSGCAFHVDGKGDKPPKPVAVFVVPKAE